MSSGCVTDQNNDLASPAAKEGDRSLESEKLLLLLLLSRTFALRLIMFKQVWLPYIDFAAL